MKKQTRILSLCAILFLMGNFLTNLGQSYLNQTDNFVQIHSELSTNNFEIMSRMGAPGTYTNFENPSFDDENFEHENTRVEITKLQQFDEFDHNSSLIDLTADSVYSTNTSLNYSLAGGFDSQFLTNLTFDNNYLEYISDIENDHFTSKNATTTPFSLVAANVESNVVNAYEITRTYITPTLYTDVKIAKSFTTELNEIDSSTLNFSSKPPGYQTSDYVIAEFYFDPVSTIAFNYTCIDDPFQVQLYSTTNVLLYEGAATPSAQISCNNFYYARFLFISEGAFTVHFDELHAIHDLGEHEVLLEVTNDYSTILNSSIEINANYRSDVNFDVIINSNTYSQLSTRTNFSISEDFSSNLNITLSFFAENQQTLNISSLSIKTCYNFIDSLNQTVFYSILNLDYSDNISTTLTSSNANYDRISMIYACDSSRLSEYDYINDVEFTNNLTTYILSNKTLENVNFSISTTTSNWVVPSEVDFKINNVAIIDETFNSGYIAFDSHQNQLAFSATVDNLLFNFTLLSYYNIEIQMDVISKTYLDKTLLLTSNHEITLTQLDILFDSDMKHIYLNNVNIGKLKSNYLSQTIEIDSTLHIEIILDDDAYLPLTKESQIFANSSSILDLHAISYSSLTNIGTQSILFQLPLTMQLNSLTMTISNIRYLQYYMHTENDVYNIYSESQLYPQLSQSTSSNLDSYLHTENSTSSDIYENQTISDVNQIQSSNFDSYLHTENSISNDVYENQTIPVINPYSSTNYEYKTNFTLYTTNSSETESYDITPIGITDSTNGYSQKLTLPESKMFQNFTGVNLTVTNNSQTYNDSMSAHYSSQYTFDSYTDLSNFTFSNGYSYYTDNTIHQQMLAIGSNSQMKLYDDFGNNFECSLYCSFPDLIVAGANSSQYIEFKFAANDAWENLIFLRAVFSKSSAGAYTISLSDFSNTVSTSFAFTDFLHLRFLTQSNAFTIFVDGVSILALDLLSAPYLRTFAINTQYTDALLLIDALDISTDDDYYAYRNAREIIIQEDHGHYQGAYSFDHDIVNQKPSDWNIYGSTSLSALVSSTRNSHSKILNITGTVNDWLWRSLGTTTASGNFECWIMKNNTAGVQLYLGSLWDETNAVCTLSITSTGAVEFKGTTTASDCAIILTNRWYHIRIEYVNNGECNLYVDSLLNATITGRNCPASTSLNLVLYHLTNTGQNWYLDAIDFSWASGYYINRNCELNQSTDLFNWNAFPEWNGEYYQGAFSFDDGLIPQYWNVFTGGGETVTVVDEIANRKTVCYLSDTATSPNYAQLYKGYGDPTITTGSIEFYFYLLDYNVIFCQSNGMNIYLYHGSGFTVFNGSTPSFTPNPYVGSWHHLRITFDYNTDKYSVYLDGICQANNFDMTSVQPYLMSFTIITWDIGSGGIYVDSIDTSWSSGYFLNRNMFENTTTSKITNRYELWDGSYYYKYTLYNESDSFYSDTFTFNVITNFTQSPIMNIGYQSVTQCGENATFSILITKSFFEITLVKAYDSITNTNSTIGTTNGTYTYTVYSSYSRSYSVTFYTTDIGGYYRSFTVENLYFAKNRTVLMLDYSKTLFQRANLNLTTTLTQSIYNLNENRSITIRYPNSTQFLSINNSINSKLGFITGWYAVNISYPGTNQYLSCSMLRVFEVIATPTPAIYLSYSKSVHVGEINLFNITASRTLYNLSSSQYNIGYSENSESLSAISDNQQYSIQYNITTSYNASIYITDIEGFWTQINISNIFVAKNRTVLMLDYSKTLYQRANLNLTTTLTQSIYSLTDNRLITVRYPNSTQLIAQNNVINTKLGTQTGWYAVNVTYPGTNQYLSCSMLRVFEVIATPTPSVIVSYSKSVHVGEINLFNITASRTLYNLSSSQYNIGYSENTESLSAVSDNQQYSIQYNTTTSYNASIYVVDIEGFWTQINISNIFVAKNSSEFTFTNLYRSYYQNSTVNISTTLTRNVSISMYYPNSTLMNSAANRTFYNLGWSDCGYYQIYAEFNDTTNQYLNYSITTNYEVLGVARSIELSQTVNFVVNSTAVVNNSLTLSNLNNSFRLVFNADSITTFDVALVYYLNYSAVVDFQSEYAFEFLQSANISSIQTTNVTFESFMLGNQLENIVYNGQSTSNYTLSNQTFILIDAINSTFYNRDSFSLIICEEDFTRSQIDAQISTKDTSVRFREYYSANRTYSKWYIESNLDVNSVAISHMRTDLIMTTTEDDSYFYFTNNQTTINDFYSVDWSLDPGFNVTSEILSNNGTFIRVKIDVESALDLENVTVYFTNPVYFSNWTNATQDSYNYEVNFFSGQINSGENIFYLEASREVPFANLWYYQSQVNVFMYPNSTQTPAYYTFLQYPEYSEVWEIIPESHWILDGVHYMNRSYTIANNTFFCEGFDQSITSSFLYFAANPLNSFDVVVNETSSEIILTIDLNLPLNQTILMFPVNISGNFDIKTRGVSELYELDGYTWFMIDDELSLAPGTTTIIISYEVYSLKNSWWYAIPIMAIMLGGVWWYLEKKKKELAQPKEKIVKQPKNVGKGDVK